MGEAVDTTLLELVAKRLKLAIKDLYNLDIEPHTEFPNDTSHGDISSNVAMQLTKDLKKAPIVIAQELKVKILESDVSPAASQGNSGHNDQIFENVQEVAPGFINITLSPAFYSNYLHTVSTQQTWQFTPPVNPETNKKKRVIVEYGSENIAKSMTVGHLRSNIIGQALYNIYKTLGWDVISDNHLGDWGTQFGKLIVAYKKWGDKKTVEAHPIDELVKLYVRFHDEAEKEPALDDEGREEFRKLENGDPENTQLWKWFYEVSMKEFKEMYALLGVHHDNYLGESFYVPHLKDSINFCLEKGIAVKNEDGSIAVDLHDNAIPTFLIQKSNGSTLYHTRDFATLKYRMDEYDPDLILYVIGADQKLYFKQLFAATKTLGWHGEFFHIDFGMIRFPEGKMSTRKGRSIKLRDLINEGFKRAEALIATKNVQTDNKKELIRQLTIGSIKFNDLSQNRSTDITFDWDRMLSFEGATAPYLQYAYVRTQSILNKIDFEVAPELHIESDEPRDRDLAYRIAKFPDYLKTAADSFKPSILAQYLLELASAFASYYEQVPILHEKDHTVRNNRLALVKAMGVTLKQGLEILGIECPARM